MTSSRSVSRRRRPLRRQGSGVSPVLMMTFLLLTVAFTWINVSLSNVESMSLSTPQSSIMHHHDPFYVQNYPQVLKTNHPGICDVPPGVGEEGPEGIQGLFKIKTNLNQTIKESSSSSHIRVLCMVYTHSGRHDVLQSIVETYAPSCDGFMAASNKSDPSLGAFVLPDAEPEEYGNMWNKVRAMWMYAYQNYRLEFDWFHIGGDDMYIIPNNIRQLASSFDPNIPRILGGSIPNSKNPKRRFCGGGAGYTLNQKALHLLVSRLLSGDCPAEPASDEDVRLSRCLEDAYVKCTDTNDNHNEPTYHHLDVQFHAAWTPGRKSLWLWEKLQFFHNIQGNQSKLAQISKSSISFHLDKSVVRSKYRDRGIRRYHAILYDKCGIEFSQQVTKAATCSSEEREVISLEWKKTAKVKDSILLKN